MNEPFESPDAANALQACGLPQLTSEVLGDKGFESPA